MIPSYQPNYLHQSPPLRVLFKPHAIAALAEELARLGVTRPVILAGATVSRGTAYAQMCARRHPARGDAKTL